MEIPVPHDRESAEVHDKRLSEALIDCGVVGLAISAHLVGSYSEVDAELHNPFCGYTTASLEFITRRRAEFDERRTPKTLERRELHVHRPEVVHLIIHGYDDLHFDSIIEPLSSGSSNTGEYSILVPVKATNPNWKNYPIWLRHNNPQLMGLLSEETRRHIQARFTTASTYN